MSDGEPGAAVAVYRDVSAEKELEREREAWTGIVAHDLRQPTSVISFSAQLLARYGDGLGPREAKSVQRIASAARTLSRMIDDLLDVTMIEAQGLKLSLSSVDVAALVREVVDRCRPAYEGRRVDIRTPAAAFVQADPNRVAQVVTNLVSNAVKYSAPASGVDVRVERNGGVVRVAVENHGTGLTAEERQRIFQRFYRTRAAHDGAVGGLGLGLYISKGIVEAHGGQMGVESVPGQTTTFWFRLPERSEGASLGA